MKITEISDYHISPGLLREWETSVPGDSAGERFPTDPTPPSYNQEWHFNALVNLRDRGITAPAWLGVGFEIPGKLDTESFRETLRRWVERHETLRSGFRAVDGGGFERFTLDSGMVFVRDTSRGWLEPGEVGDRVQERLDRATDGLRWPNYVVETVERDESSTVVVGFDHSNVDAYSVFASVGELRDLYVDVVSGKAADTVEAGSYVAFSGQERAAAERIGADHPSVAHWRRFVADCGGRLPGFPLDLGATEGVLLPHTFAWEWLLDPSEAESFEKVCRRSACGFLAGVLTAAAIAAHELTGESVYRTVVPLDTRTDPAWADSMGWYVDMGPFEVSLDRVADFQGVVRRAQDSARSAMCVARTPFFRVIRFLDLELSADSPDVFSFVSFIDMRKVPGADRWSEWNSRVLVRMPYGSKTNVWANRTHDGVYALSRYPDTEVGRKNVSRFFECMQAVLRSVARTGNYAFR